MEPEAFAKARLKDLVFDLETWGLRAERGRYPLAVVAGEGLLHARGRFEVSPLIEVPHDVYIDISETWEPHQRHLWALQRCALAEREGFWLDEFSYQLVVDEVRWRYDLDSLDTPRCRSMSTHAGRRTRAFPLRPGRRAIS